MPTRSFQIERYPIGILAPVFIIAEAGVNHNGSLEKARKLICEAKLSGADCVKFQTFKAEHVVSPNAPKARYQLRTTDPAESQIEMLRSIELDAAWYAELIDLCRSEGIIFSSTPYNEGDIDFLMQFDVPFLKAASLHIAEPLFLKRMAETGKPLVISTGMATLDEVRCAVDVVRETGNNDFVIMQCTTNYPSEIEDANLRAMTSMAKEFECFVGYSDHSQSNIPCIAATAMGACVIEKHFTLDTHLPGPDHSASYDPQQFAALVRDIRLTETALGSQDKKPTPAEQANMIGMRRSIVAIRDIPRGKAITNEDLSCRRPASGIPPYEMPSILGCISVRNIKAGEMLSWNDIA